MIEFEDYQKVAADYARIRKPIGLSIVQNAFSDCAQPIEERRLIDIGCGAAIYTAELAGGFSSVLGIDKSSQQILQGQKRVESLGIRNVALEVGDARYLSAVSSGFDAALISLMLHHVRAEDGIHFKEQRKVLSEASRVLRSGGSLVVALCTRRQIRDGAWYCSLMPERVLDIYCDFSPDINAVLEESERLGLRCVGRFIQTDAILQGSEYFDEEGPTKASWRNGDSIWSLLTPDELAEVISRTEQMRLSGQLGRYIGDHTERLKEFGQATFLVFKRS